ncbi:hypothetical protein AB0C91_09965 [Streptomyces sp. NPDC048674]|uniref:hypothetical protein n=1 Tax=Streptomyces sp. NPDC048674 TaxID=3155491 RepID=UPI00343B37A7
MTEDSQLQQLASLQDHAARTSRRTGLAVTVEPFEDAYALSVTRPDGVLRHGGYGFNAVFGMLLGIDAVKAGDSLQPQILEAEVVRLRAGEEPVGDPRDVPTPGQWIGHWNAAAAEERLEIARRIIEDRGHAAQCRVRGALSEPRLLDCGFCYEEQGEEVHPHPECPVSSRMTPVSPTVEIINALSERLDQLPEQPTVFAGGRDSRLLIDGNFYAVSSEHPVVLDAFGSGIPGGRLTLTLNCDRITVDGKEIGE